eukprot:TRINITY_DN13792_c0_g1_i1.p1 TRINITY_DN13792_c0_g1~~TRINITY_DN13792_c0_g1_i1.p1  ORF type:complete len:326 (-),score=73.03 TRINITY_DN13792_c0_g1_i1:93-1013(-)
MATDQVTLCKRYVSMIPFLEDSVIFVGKSNVWSSSKQCISMRAGDWEEHAILLCNFFLHLHMDAYVCLGSGNDGNAAYVVVKDGTSITIHNPVFGISTDSSDPTCSLKEVSLIFNDKNIWMNIQETGRPYLCQYDFNNAKEWTPFYGIEFPEMPLATIQQDIVFDATPEKFIRNLESELEELLMETTRSMRGRFVTRWNTKASRILKGLLPIFEDSILQGRDGQSRMETEHQKQMATLTLANYRLHNGFPLCIPYSDKEDIIEKVINTGVQKNDDARAEFAVAIRVEGYPNRICAVWVYLASFLPH